MMNKLALLTILLIPISLSAQSMKEFNKEKGFGTFKLGTAIKKFDDIQRYGGAQTGDLYEYNGAALDGILSEKQSSMTLFFPEGKLNEIRIFYSNPSQELYDKLLKELEDRYGSSKEGSDFMKSSHTAFRHWVGEEHYLRFTYNEGDKIMLYFKYDPK